MNNQYFDVSKFLSYVLRHRPDAIGIALDREGWADISALIASAVDKGKQLDRELIQMVVTTSDKKRFAISEDGYSVCNASPMLMFSVPFLIVGLLLASSVIIN